MASSIYSATKLPNKNNHLNHNPPPTINNKIFSNLFFQLSPHNSRPFQINEIHNQYDNYINRYFNNPYHNPKLNYKSSEYNTHKKRIMNELFFVYDRISTEQPTGTNEFNEYSNSNKYINNSNKKYTSDNNDNFFPTQIDSGNASKKRNKSEHKCERVVKDNDTVDENEIDDDEYGIGYVKPIYPGKRYIILKGKNKCENNDCKTYANDVYLELDKKINNDKKKHIRKDYDLFIMGNELHEIRKPPIKFK